MFGHFDLCKTIAVSTDELSNIRYSKMAKSALYHTQNFSDREKKSLDNGKRKDMATASGGDVFVALL